LGDLKEEKRGLIVKGRERVAREGVFLAPKEIFSEKGKKEKKKSSF